MHARGQFVVVREMNVGLCARARAPDDCVWDGVLLYERVRACVRKARVVAGHVHVIRGRFGGVAYPHKRW